MTSLEFIEEQIEELKELLVVDVVLLSNKYDIDEIENKKERLKILEQIKTELEAWEVVKIYTDTSEDTVNTEYYFIKGMDSEFETIKKALEVKE